MLKINPVITVAFIAVCLACASFFYQQPGPEVGKFGTECVPIKDCYRAVLGGGFPMQYVIDIPGITYQDRLYIEDEFRVWPFILDVIFYFALGQIASRLVLNRSRTAQAVETQQNR